MNSWLGRSQGFFKLSESDKYVGSFISKEDVKEIMDVSDLDLRKVKFENRNGIEVIDEVNLRKEWENGSIFHAPCHYCGNTKVSLDELILTAIIRRTYPTAKVERQFKMGNKRIDIWAEVDGRGFFVEFVGPGHFRKSKKRKNPDSPLKRKQEVEIFFDKEGFKCYIWPYWIQRCSLNLRVLVEQIQKCGRGALWSSKSYFGDFEIDNAMQVIHELTAQFHAVPDGKYGYFYEGKETDTFVKPEHFIINDIICGKKDYHILIPKDVSSEEEDKWLPSKVVEWKKINK